MENRKVVFKLFTIPQYRQEEDYLSSMHEKGWRLTKIILPGFYHFEACEPEKVTYRLDYNQEGIKNKTEYVQLFTDCGWNYLFDFVGYSYFYKKGNRNQEREEIFCDDSSRFDMMKRVFKGKLIPLLILFVCAVLPQLFTNTIGYGGGDVLQDVLSFVFFILAMIYLAIFSITAYWFYRYEKKLSPEDSGILTKYVGIFLLILLLVLGIGLFFYVSKRSVYTVSESADGFTITAERLNKPVVREYDLKKGDLLAVSHTYDGGELFIRVGEENKEPIFYGNSYHGMGDFTLEIQEDGRYKIECIGRKAKGMVQFVIE